MKVFTPSHPEHVLGRDSDPAGIGMGIGVELWGQGGVVEIWGEGRERVRGGGGVEGRGEGGWLRYGERAEGG